MQKNVRNLVFAAMIAALYTALCLALAPFSYGMVQVRAAEALTLLPIFSPIGVWGVALGCALSNLVGFMTGANILGYLDIFFGTAATLLAALATRKLRRIRFRGVPVAAVLPPILFNAAVIGAELAVISGPRENFWIFFAANAASVGAGQLLSCAVLGLPLCCLLERTGAARKCFGGDTDT